jgi:hypothetical protein
MPGRPIRALIVMLAAAAGCAGSPAPGAAPRSPSPTDSATVTPAASPSPDRPCGWRSTASYRRVVWIWMENRSYGDVLGRSGDGARLKRYAARCGVATDYHALTHPSLPNYLAAVAGRTWGVSTDCSPATCSLDRRSLFGQVTAAGRHWNGYAESMLERCDRRSYGRYAARHNPAVYFLPIRTQCRHRDVRMGGRTGRFAEALAANSLPAFSFVTPNLCHDGHDCSTAAADDWLGRWLDRIVSSRAYALGRTVVVVTWDEDDGSAANRVPTVVIAPTVPPGTRVGRRLTHYSLLRATEQLLGLPLLQNAKTAPRMLGPFHLR